MTAPRPLTPAELAEYQERARDYKTFSPSAGRRLLATLAERDRQLENAGVVLDEDSATPAQLADGARRLQSTAVRYAQRAIGGSGSSRLQDALDALAAPSDGGGKGGG